MNKCKSMIASPSSMRAALLSRISLKCSHHLQIHNELNFGIMMNTSQRRLFSSSHSSLLNNHQQEGQSRENSELDYKTQYEKFTKDLAQRVVDIFHAQKNCQLTSFGGSESTSVEHLKTSVVPMAIVKKSISEIYLSEFKKKPKKNENTEEHLEGIKYYEDISGFEDEGFNLKHFDIYICMPDGSDHLANIANAPEPMQIRRKLLPTETAIVSIATGHSDQILSSMFHRIGRMPPRATISATLETIPKESEANHQIWTEQFRMHPHVSIQMKKANANIFRVRVVKSAFFLDEGSVMKEIQDMDHLSRDVVPDPLAASTNIKTIIRRLNGNPERVAAILQKGFGIHLSDFFVYELNSYCMRIMGRDASYGNGKREGSEFSTYELDHGYRISTEAMFDQYLSKFHNA